MKVLVRVEGRDAPLSVEIVSDDGREVRAIVDGVELCFRSQNTGIGRPLVEANGTQAVLDILGEDGHYEIIDDHGSLRFEVVDERDTWLGSGAGGDVSGVITAAMPGRIVEVTVAEGQTVSRGDRLLVIEAMKMENDVNAPRDGVVKAVHASAGCPVEAGERLIELE